MLTDMVLGPAWRNGMQIENSILLVGQRGKSAIVEFALTPNGPINERNIAAYDKMFVDTLDAIETPMGTVWVNLDRYMDLPGETLAIDNTALTPTPGTADITIPCDEVIAVIMPEYYKIGILRGASFRPLSSDGDFTFGMVVGEETVITRNPLAGTGCSNFFN